MDANQYISMLLREYRKATMEEMVPGYAGTESPDYRYYLGMAVGLGFVNRDGSPVERIEKMKEGGE